MSNRLQRYFPRAAKVTFVLSVVLLHVSGAQTNREQQEIRRLRTEFNRAIAAHNAAGLPRFWREDLHVTTGVGKQLAGSAAVRAAFETIFADPSFVAYTRTPDKIELSASGVRAAESGHWLGEWKKPDGKMEWARNLSGDVVQGKQPMAAAIRTLRLVEMHGQPGMQRITIKQNDNQETGG